MRRLIVATIALSTLMGGAASAGQPLPFNWRGWEYEDTQQPVEQQTQGGALQPDQSLWVVNNTTGNNNPQGNAGLRCGWDADDSRSMGDTDGSLNPGATATGTKCWIIESTEPSTYVSVNSRSPDLVVTLRWDPQGFSVTAPAVWDPAIRLYRYEACTFGPDYSTVNSPPMEAIPNSGTAPNIDRPDIIGGYGVPSVVTASINNPTGGTVRGINAVTRIRCCSPSSASAGRCPEKFFEWVNGQLVYYYQHRGTYPGPFIWIWTPTIQPGPA